MIKGMVFESKLSWGFFTMDEWESLVFCFANEIYTDIPFSFWLDIEEGKYVVDEIAGLSCFSESIIKECRPFDIEKDGPYIRFAVSYMMRTGVWCEIWETY